MTDRELLEAAARIAGIDGVYRTENWCLNGNWTDITAIFLDDDWGWWNPLTDDGDAFRLASNFNLFFDPMFSKLHSEELASDTDPISATRRALIRTLVNRS